jgi:CheY-like chemotaxis protein
MVYSRGVWMYVGMRIPGNRQGNEHKAILPGVEYVAMERGRTTIMLADDDPVALKSATEALTGAGFKVVQAADGQRALQEALSRRVDLIVMDVSMPQVGGVEACHCLKAMPKTSKIPVVLTAAKKDPAARTLAERTHGSVRILRKPFTPEELISLARQLVKHRSLLY